MELKKGVHLVRSIILDCADWIHRFFKGKLYLPPKKLRDVGGDDLADFERTGYEFLQYFKDFIKLSPDAVILEIGCGSGRLALPLTTYLSSQGKYTGVEIIAPSVRWCSRNITKKFPNFTFIHADLYNKRYNPQATIPARQYRFPFPNASFDFIYLTSVFTHLLSEDMEHYLSEIIRLLNINGKVLITCFLLNDKQRQYAFENKNKINFVELDDHCQVRDFEVPESAVAYEEEYLIGLLEKLGFHLHSPVLYGTWSGHRDGLSFQDILILSRGNSRRF